MRLMGPIAHIRKQVFAVNQAEFAVIAGAAQSTVCRWERGELQPDRGHMGCIRAEALRRGMAWDDQWFWELPVAQAVAA